MPILQRYNNDPILGELQNLFGNQLNRLDQLYLGDLNEDELDFAIYELATIDPPSFKNFVKPALDTNQGVSRTIREGLGFANGSELRIRMRSFAILHAVTVQMYLEPYQAGKGTLFTIKEEVQGHLKRGGIDTVTAACNAAIADIREKKKQNDLIEEQRARREAEEAERARKEEAKRKKIAAQQMWAKHLNPYKERLLFRRRVAGHAQALFQGMHQATNFTKQLKTVGEPFLETQAKAAEQSILTYLRSAKGDKFIQFQQGWNDAGAQLKEIGALIDEANKEFMEAVGKDDANFQEARDFKVKCIKGVFEAVKSYAPAPFNIVGTAGMYFMEWAAEATEAVATTWEFARAQTADDQDIQAAMDAAEAKVKKTKNRIFMDHGVSTKMEAAALSSSAKIECVLNTAAATFYHALAEIKMETDAATLLAQVQTDVKFQKRRIANSGNNLSRIMREGQIMDGGAGVKAEYQTFAPGLFTEGITKEQGRVENLVSAVHVPVLGISRLGSDEKLKRYLTLYLTGKYIQEKSAQNKAELFVLQTNISALLAKYKFLHSYTDSTKREDTTLGMSLPWVLANSKNQTGLIFKSTHHSYSVRVNILLRKYAANTDLMPFAAMVNNKADTDIETYLVGEDEDLKNSIKTAKTQGRSARLSRYLEMQDF